MTTDAYFEALRSVVDPELNIDIVTLGLVYDLAVRGEEIHVTLTLTSPLCPFRRLMLEEIRRVLASKAPDEVRIVLSVVFDPPWEPSPELRARFGL